MPPPYCYDFPRPAVTVDIVALARKGKASKLFVLLIRRKHDPFAGRWALPGGFVEIEEPLEAAARRELKEETGVDYRGPLAVLGGYGDPGRDPRGWTISLAYAATFQAPLPRIRGADDAEEAAWLDVAKVNDLAFDHDRILAKAIAWFQSTWT